MNERPFISFNFLVEIAGTNGEPLCNAEFSECDGLEMTMEVKTIREGGRNTAQVRLAGPQSFGSLTLKRGMTRSFDLWDWFGETMHDPGLRADAQIVLLAADHETVCATFKLSRCIPIKLKAPALNAKDGIVAVEEFQMAYETLELEKPR
jgi:phage tail-like protein